MTPFSSSPWLMLLGLVPVAHVALLYLLSKRRGMLWHGDLYAIKYMDWVFVPFNLLIPLSVVFNWWLAVSVLVPLLGIVVYLNKRWHTIGRGRKKTYFTDRNGLTPEGWTHFVFMVVQGTLLVTAVLSPATSPWYVVMLACLFVYLTLYILILRYVRRVALRSKAEYPFIVLGMLAVVVRLVIVYTMQ